MRNIRKSNCLSIAKIFSYLKNCTMLNKNIQPKLSAWHNNRVFSHKVVLLLPNETRNAAETVTCVLDPAPPPFSSVRGRPPLNWIISPQSGPQKMDQKYLVMSSTRVFGVHTVGKLYEYSMRSLWRRSGTIYENFHGCDSLSLPVPPCLQWQWKWPILYQGEQEKDLFIDLRR